MRPGRPSLTAIGVAALRAIADLQPGSVSTDPLAPDLLPRPFGPLVRRLRALPRATGALLAGADWVSGGGSRHLELRTRAIDDLVREHVGRGIGRVVLLGAGLDARPYRLATLGATWVEIDFAATQTLKKRALARAGVDASSVAFFATDFRGGALGRVLDDAVGGQPSFVVWEGVPMYLPEAAIRASLAAMSASLSIGSAVAMTYLGKRPPPWLRAGVAAVGERFESVVPKDALAQWLVEYGFRVTRDESDPEWYARYLGREGRTWAIERLACAERC